MPFYYTVPPLKRRRQQLRNSATPTEVRLWYHLRGRRLRGYKFRRQHSVGRYVLDFYCPVLRLAIEVDGGYHQMIAQRVNDRVRDRWLRHFRILVVRISAADVNTNIEVVVEYLGEVVHQRRSHPWPSAIPSKDMEGTIL